MLSHTSGTTAPVDLSLRYCAADLADAHMRFVFSDGSADEVCEQARCAGVSLGAGDCRGAVRNSLERIKEMLRSDAQAAFDRDPSASSLEEVILCYPGLYALAVYRLSHALYEAGVQLLPRVLSETAHSKTGVDIHPGAKIGENFFMDHATGIVIGETAEIRDNVTLYQGVTIGSLKVARALRGIKRHPTLESGVTVYANATILGGDTVIGENSVIGGNVFLAESVPPNSVVYELHKIEVKAKKFGAAEPHHAAPTLRQNNAGESTAAALEKHKA